MMITVGGSMRSLPSIVASLVVGVLVALAAPVLPFPGVAWLLAAAAVTVAFGLAVRLWSTREPDPPDPDADVERAAADLAEAVRKSAPSRRYAGTYEFRLRWRDTSDSAVAGDAEAAAAHFRGLAEPRMALLGTAGSGKSELAWRVMGHLLAGWQPGDAVPVPVRSNEWDFADTLTAWLTRHLTTAYQVPVGAATELVTSGRVVAVLDGLDELPAALREAAARQLSQGGSARLPIVITYGTREYAQLPAGIRLESVLEAEPLSAQDVRGYLEVRAKEDHREAAWQPVLDDLCAHPEGRTAQLLASPLMATLAHAAYATAGDPAELVQQGQDASRAGSSGRVIERALEALSADRDPDRRRWLASIAAMMTVNGRAELVWSDLVRLRPSIVWVVGWPRWIALVAAAAYVGVATGRPWAAAACAVAIVAALARTGLTRFHAPTRLPARPLLAAARVAWFGAAGFAVAAAAALAERGAVAPAALDRRAVAVGVLGAVVAGRAGLGLRRADASADHGQSRLDDLRAALLRAATVAAVAAVTCVTWLGAAGTVPAGPPIALAVTVFAVVLLDCSAWGQYQWARRWLAGRLLLPKDFEEFLTWAVGSGVLLQERGSYRFVHPLVRRRFAGEADAWGSGGPAALICRAEPEIADRVLAMPEVKAFIGAGGGRPRTDQIRRLTHDIIQDNSADAAEAGNEQYLRFHKARERLAAAFERPLWSRPAPVYLLLLRIATGVSAAGCGYLLLPADWVALAAAVVAVAAVLGIVLQVHLGRQQAQGPRARPFELVRWPSLIGLFVALAWLLRLPELAGGALGGVTLAAAVAVPVFTLALTAVRPHADDVRRLRSDDAGQWPPSAARTGRPYEAAVQARNDWLATLTRGSIMPKLREKLLDEKRQHPDAAPVTALPKLDPSHLGGILQADQIVPTSAAGDIEWLLSSLDSASIGVSGARGAGKTTLLRRFATVEFGASPKDLIIYEPAPTSYDRREFLVHLFTQVCLRVLDGASAVAPPRRTGRRVRWLPVAAVAAGLALAAGAQWWAQLAGWWHHPRVPLLVIGALLVLGGVLWSALAVRGNGRRPAPTELELAAADHLRTLQYESSVSQTYTSKLGVPGSGFEVGLTGQHTRKELAVSYPELVARFRDLLDRAALERRPYGNRIIVAIDELDKMSTPEDAERFLNDLKAVFGIRGTFFLVAVSEDAMSTYDRRTLGVRTAFDSAFDKIVAAPCLPLGDLQAMLEARGIGLPDPFLWLCHALSGGIPRDLFRAVLDLAALQSSRGPDRLPEIAAQLIERDLARVISAKLQEAAARKEPEPGPVVAWLNGILEAPTRQPGRLERLAHHEPGVDEPECDAHLRLQVRVYLYHCATLLRFFAGGVASPAVLLGSRSIDQLAHARADLATQPDRAWHAIERFRCETNAGWPDSLRLN
ncbi:NACHT domain-containing protein [Dactylosporangium sp. CS-033363]|uniref:NACHT domain-containing protein n=1 Tax=Dactylosporangium sp. CS-033363 TaxID=3239935 RepID=UPI003D8B188A